jgi:hypothetical protein
MREQLLFNVVFLGQVVFVSLLFPWQVVSRVRHMIAEYPPAQYPRLYPRPLDAVRWSMFGYLGVNFAVAGAGLALLAAGVGSPAEGMLVRDNDLVQVGFLMAQLVAFLIGPAFFFPYYSLRRSTDGPRTRTASLRPRRVFDYVPPVLLAVAVGLQIAFAGFVVAVNRFDFPWFGGYANLAIMAGVNLFFAAMIYKLVYGKRQDPYTADADRERGIAASVRLLLLTSIAATLFVAMTIALQIFELGVLKPTAMSLYVQLLALASVRSFRTGDVDFDVYREDAATT